LSCIRDTKRAFKQEEFLISADLIYIQASDVWKKGSDLSGRPRDGIAGEIRISRVNFLGKEGLLRLLPWQEKGK